MRAEVHVRDVAAAVAYQQPLPGQESLARQPVESGQHHALGQVAGRPEEDEERRPCRGIRLLRHGRHASKLRACPGPPGAALHPGRLAPWITTCGTSPGKWAILSFAAKGGWACNQSSNRSGGQSTVRTAM